MIERRWEGEGERVADFQYGSQVCHVYGLIVIVPILAPKYYKKGFSIRLDTHQVLLIT